MNWRKIAVIAAVPASLMFAVPAYPDGGGYDDPTSEVCGGFNLGLSPEQIAEGLRRNDARYNYWRAWHTTIWPIIDGDCG
ncbi:MAG TPA: hypothetical protein VFR27_11000 [Mycobacterium sp.]|nr:hypothetical protein [Mycobacterium sp.]